MCVSSFFCVIFFLFSPLCPCFSLLSSRGLAVHPICNNVVLSATTVGVGGRRWRISRRHSHSSRFPMSYDTGRLGHCICIVHELESGASFVGGWTRDASSAVRDARHLISQDVWGAVLAVASFSRMQD
ncbi:hypothetical protein B0H13DRAFT_2150122, partial [Mycena leptocephala]